MDALNSNSNVYPDAGSAGGERRYPVEFTATAGEYFRIWIVNLALTIITLGVYSAWAKVRKKRYFYGHTRIDGEGFEYRANPVAILKGRLIAVAAVILFYGSGKISWQLQLASFGVGLFISPWLIVRSMAFNAYNSAYRNIRLHFRSTYFQCLKLIIGYGLLVIITLGLGYPYMKRRMVQFAAENHYYGVTQFAVADLKKIFLRIYSNAIGIGILLGIVAVVLTALGATTLGMEMRRPTGTFFIVQKLFGYVCYLGIFAYLRARVANATWNSITIGPVRFECALRALEVYWLYLVNISAIILTVGLATPWAVIRTLRYRAEKMTVIATDALDHFVAGESTQVAAAGEEVSEMFDIGIGL